MYKRQEGDCPSLITKLRTKEALVAEIGLFIDQILVLCKDFDFIGFSFVRRGGNTVAHFLQPYNPMPRIWLEDGPDAMFDLAINDLCYSHQL